eukprot:JP438280.1.p1 GENE.JP438280.1~~JP438280.1.p1  ORF type:complete len:139 (-),score=13.60 JP438280.1:18-434(-)
MGKTSRIRSKVKVKQKPKKIKLKPDGMLAKHWDPKATVQENYKNLGLSYNMNRSTRLAESVQEKTPAVLEIEEAVKYGVSAVKFCSPGEKDFVEGMVAKHGSNYKAMERDRKLNFYQHTEAQIRKKCEKYQKLYGSTD